MQAIQWEGTFRRYAESWVSKNHWRVARNYDRDDCIQECAIVFTKCRNKYIRDPRHPHAAVSEQGGYKRVDNAAWFMALYKTALSRHWIHLGRVQTKRDAAHEAENESGMCVPQVEHNSGPVLATLQTASAELRSVLSIIARAPAEALTYIFVLGGEDIDEVETNARLRAYCKLSARTNLLTELRELLT